MQHLESRYKSTLAAQPSENFRMDLKLLESNDTFFNAVSYKTLNKAAQGESRYEPSDGDSDNTNDYIMDYEEDSCIDNSGVFPDSFPPGMEPECGGFFVNRGTLKLKSVQKPVEPSRRKKQVPTRRKIVGKKSDDTSPSENKDAARPKTGICKKRVSKNDANAKLDTILMVLLKERLKTQDPSSKSSKSPLLLSKDLTSRSSREGPSIKHTFVSQGPRVHLSFVKMPPKI